MKIVRHPVQDTHIAEIGFDPKHKVLEIAYKTGAVFRYYEVPELEYDQLMNAAVKDLHMTTHMHHKYRYEMLKSSDR
ncbi:MAG: KTSC domain-containing protein [Verrucomicrobiae bacterium]|nr:KTSC domain-containing protein [Verrucomicrobiae bacterium]